jgi:hypothetical protein
MFLSNSSILKDNILNDITDERNFQEIIKDITLKNKLKRVLKSFNSNDNKKKSKYQINEIFSNEVSVIHFGIIIFNKWIN